MILKVKPTDYLKGSIELPASKSYSIRAFMIAMRGGNSRITAPSNCDDAKVSMAVAKKFGAKISFLNKNTWSVMASAGKCNFSQIDVKESGTVLRFLLPILSLYRRKACVVGRGTLRGRPNYHLTHTLRKQGVCIRGRGAKECIPIQLKGGELKGGKIEIDGSLSSQFISALLIACPELPEDSKILIKGDKVVSSDYILMTQQVLKRSGIRIKKVNNRLYQIKGRQKFRGLKNFVVPSDYGLAAFALAAGALCPSKITLKGFFDDRLLQADGKILDFLRKLGVKYKRTSQAIQVQGPFIIKGGSFSLKDCPDLLPIMSVLALFAKRKVRLFHIQHARLKESDRISDLRKELLKIGARIIEKEDELIIHPLKFYKRGVLLDSHRDHRLAMAFFILGLKLGARVKDIECVNKSYPGFVSDMRKLGAKVIK